MKLSLLKNLLKSPFILLKHIILFCIINSLMYYLFNNFLFNLMVDVLSTPLTRLIRNEYFVADVVLYYFCVILKTIIIASFFVLALNNDNEEIKNDLFLYITDFFSSSYNVILSGLAFIIITLFSCLGVITFVFFINFCVFFLVFATVRKNEKGERFSAIASISESFKLTKTFRTKLFVFNTILFSIVAFLLYTLPDEIYVDTFNISYLIKLYIIDTTIVYVIKICFAMEKIRNEKIEETAQKEMENEFSAAKGLATV